MFRLLTAFVLVFAMFRPALRYQETDKQASQLVILMDASRSMTTADGPGGLTRREALLRLLSENQSLLEELGEDLELRFLDFDENLRPTDTASNQTDGKMTAIGKVLDELRKEDLGKRLVGIILLSDGAQRAIGDANVDPLAAARRFAEQRQVPIHTVTLGESELTGVGIDLAVEDVLVDPLAFEKKTVPVRFQLRAQGAAGRKVRTRLLIERQGNTPQQSPEMVVPPLSADAKPFGEIEIRGNRTVLNIEHSFVAERAGEYKIAVEVVPESDEVKLANNRYETIITVRQGGLKVAYFDILRPEQAFLRRLNENARMQLTLQVVNQGKFIKQTIIPKELFQPGEYDVYLIGDVPASAFQQGDVNLLDLLAARMREGAGLGMLGGTYTYGPGGYANSPIKDFLPNEMSPAEEVAIGELPAPELFIDHPVRFLPAPDGETHYVMNVGPQSKRIWQELPDLKDGAYRLKPRDAGARVLAWSEDQDPLLLGWDVGVNRVLTFAVGDTWRWWTHGHQEIHQRFWEQAILWLARKEDESDLPVWARVTPRNYAPGETVTIEFGAQDDQKKPVTDVKMTVKIIRPDGKIVTIPHQRAGEDFLAEFHATDEPGDYWVQVNATRNNQVFGPPARTRFIVDARDPELDHPTADPDLMAEIAALTGTVPVAPEQFEEFLKSLQSASLSSQVKRYTQINLWDDWPLLLLFVLLLVTEWFVRKRRGLV